MCNHKCFNNFLMAHENNHKHTTTDIPSGDRTKQIERLSRWKGRMFSSTPSSKKTSRAASQADCMVQLRSVDGSPIEAPLLLEEQSSSPLQDAGQ
jgi:hypothetical protein